MSQNEIILKRLQQTPNQFVEMPDLVRLSGSYAINSRCADLRKQGYVIENYIKRFDGKNYSYYILYDKTKPIQAKVLKWMQKKRPDLFHMEQAELF